jgi:predicted nucleic acid-binding protein
VTVVLDASVAVLAALASSSPDILRAQDPVGPALLWSEVSSVLHEMAWRGEIDQKEAPGALDRFLAVRVRLLDPPELTRESWRVADQLGWAKTYDAQYVALARLLGCRLLTADARLARGASRLVEVVAPADLL